MSTNTRMLFLTHEDGRTQSLRQWAAEAGISRAALYSRLNSGWSLARAMAEPVLSRGARAAQSAAQTKQARDNAIAHNTGKLWFHCGCATCSSARQTSKRRTLTEQLARINQERVARAKARLEEYR